METQRLVAPLINVLIWNQSSHVNRIKNGTILKKVLKPETTDNIKPFSFA
jgi:hypothetical protein